VFDDTFRLDNGHCGQDAPSRQKSRGQVLGGSLLSQFCVDVTQHSKMVPPRPCPVESPTQREGLGRGAVVLRATFLVIRLGSIIVAVVGARLLETSGAMLESFATDRRNIRSGG
jgi:hypothetical protein